MPAARRAASLRRAGLRPCQTARARRHRSVAGPVTPPRRRWRWPACPGFAACSCRRGSETGSITAPGAPLAARCDGWPGPVRTAPHDWMTVMNADRAVELARRNLDWVGSYRAFVLAWGEKLSRLSEHLAGNVGIYAKREDCNSGLAFGGNKIRKLEFIVPDAIATNARGRKAPRWCLTRNLTTIRREKPSERQRTSRTTAR